MKNATFLLITAFQNKDCQYFPEKHHCSLPQSTFCQLGGY